MTKAKRRTIARRVLRGRKGSGARGAAVMTGSRNVMNCTDCNDSGTGGGGPSLPGRDVMMDCNDSGTGGGGPPTRQRLIFGKALRKNVAKFGALKKR